MKKDDELITYTTLRCGAVLRPSPKMVYNAVDHVPLARPHMTRTPLAGSS